MISSFCNILIEISLYVLSLAYISGRSLVRVFNVRTDLFQHETLDNIFKNTTLESTQNVYL